MLKWLALRPSDVKRSNRNHYSGSSACAAAERHMRHRCRRRLDLARDELPTASVLRWDQNRLRKEWSRRFPCRSRHQTCYLGTAFGGRPSAYRPMLGSAPCTIQSSASRLDARYQYY